MCGWAARRHLLTGGELCKMGGMAKGPASARPRKLLRLDRYTCSCRRAAAASMSGLASRLNTCVHTPVCQVDA